MKKTDIEKELEHLLMDKGLWNQLDRRSMVVYTGHKGAEMVNEALYQAGVIDQYKRRLKKLKTKKVLTNQEYCGTKSLLKSAAKADHEVAFSIIQAKEKSINQHKGHLL